MQNSHSASYIFGCQWQRNKYISGKFTAVVRDFVEKFGIKKRCFVTQIFFFNFVRKSKIFLNSYKYSHHAMEFCEMTDFVMQIRSMRKTINTRQFLPGIARKFISMFRFTEPSPSKTTISDGRVYKGTSSNSLIIIFIIYTKIINSISFLTHETSWIFKTFYFK